MSTFSIKLISLVSAVMLISTCLSNADDRLDLRLRDKPVSYRIATPRLALGNLKEKDKKEELQVRKKVKSTSSATNRKVAKKDAQRNRKTKRVVASQ